MILGEAVRSHVFEQNLSRRWKGSSYPRTGSRGLEHSACVAFVPTQIRGSHRLHWPAISIRSLTCRQQLRKTTYRLARIHIHRPKLRVRMEVPDFLPSLWTKSRADRPLGPSFEFSAEEALRQQMVALQTNDHPYPDHGVEVMYRFAGFDPFERSTYFGPRFDLGQFERFRRIFHHSSYRVLLGHTDLNILSTFKVNEHCFKQRVWVLGARPGDEETFEITLIQQVGGNWDGYWLTESILHDGDGLSSGVAY